MREKEAMLKDVTNKAALALIGAAVLSPAFQRICAQERNLPTVRSEMLVSTTWLEQHLNDRDLVVLYVGRDRGQFDSGHIPGSRFVRLDELVEQHKDSLNELPPVADLQAIFENLGVGDESRVVLDRRCGGCPGSTRLLHARLPRTWRSGGIAERRPGNVDCGIEEYVQGRKRPLFARTSLRTFSQTFL